MRDGVGALTKSANPRILYIGCVGKLRKLIMRWSPRRCSKAPTTRSCVTIRRNAESAIEGKQEPREREVRAVPDFLPSSSIASWRPPDSAACVRHCEARGSHGPKATVLVSRCLVNSSPSRGTRACRFCPISLGAPTAPFWHSQEWLELCRYD
jgi:hypothetical protein